MEIVASAEEEDSDIAEIYPLGNHLWATIANAPYLQLLHLDSRFEVKFKEVIFTLGQGAFPALQYLIFSFVRCETDRRQISVDEFAMSIVEYLGFDTREPLALLGFRHCPEKAKRDTMEALWKVADKVVCRRTGEWP